MNISLTEAINNVKTKYNTNEMRQYILLSMLIPVVFLLIFIPYFSLLSNGANTAPGSIVGVIVSFFVLILIWFILLLLLGILVGGINIIAIHNAINLKPVIFPSLFRDFKTIFEKGLIIFCCGVLASIVVNIFNQIVQIIFGGFSSAVKHLDPDSAASAVVIVLVIYVGIALIEQLFIYLMKISFSRELKFEQFFDFAFCWKILTKKVPEWTMFGVYNIVMILPWLVFVLLAGLLFLSKYAAAFQTSGFGVFDTLSSQLPCFAVGFGIAFLLTYLYFVIVQIINIDLIAQIVSPFQREAAMNKEKESEDTEIYE